MDDLISRAAAKKIVSLMVCAPSVKIAAEHSIDDLPAVDAVPVVRCKDCKHRDPEDKKCDCGDMTVQGLYFPRPDTWYCPNGERKEEQGKHE